MFQILIQKVKNYPAFTQMLKFGMVGLSNIAIDFSIYLSLTRLSGFWRQHYILANVISVSIAATSSFIWNKYWTFRDKSKNIAGQYTKFITVNAVGLGLNVGLLYILVDNFFIFDLFAKSMAVVVVFFWNFFANKFWTFRVTRYLSEEIDN